MRRAVLFFVSCVLLSGLFLATSSCTTYHKTVIVKEDTKTPQGKGKVVAAKKHFKNGVRFYKQGKYHKAIKQFQKSLAKYPGNWEAQYYLGLSHREIHDYKLATYRLELALHQSPQNSRVKSRIHTAFGLTYEQAGQPAKAAGSYELALELNARNVRAQKGLKRVRNKHIRRRNHESHG